MVAFQAKERFGPQGTLDHFIHFGVHLHAAVFGGRPLDWRRQAGVDLGYDGLAQLQVVETLRGDEAALPFYPHGAVLDLRGAAGTVRGKRGQEPVHPGAMKPEQTLPAPI